MLGTPKHQVATDTKEPTSRRPFSCGAAAQSIPLMATCSLLLRPQRPSTRPGVRLRSSPLAASPTAAKTPLLRDRRGRHHLLHTPQLLSAFLPLLLALVLPSGAAGFSVSLPSTPAAGDKRRTSDAEPSPDTACARHRGVPHAYALPTALLRSGEARLGGARHEPRRRRRVPRLAASARAHRAARARAAE